MSATKSTAKHVLAHAMLMFMILQSDEHEKYKMHVQACATKSTAKNLLARGLLMLVVLQSPTSEHDMYEMYVQAYACI